MARSSRRRRRHSKRLGTKIDTGDDRYTKDTRPDWSRKCMICGSTPTVPVSKMCGPCTFGEAETADGNW